MRYRQRLLHKLYHNRIAEKLLKGLFRSDSFLKVSPLYEFFWRSFQALHFNGISGDYLEFGCSLGGTFVLAHKASRQVGIDCKMWAFDSFQGLPKSDPRTEGHHIQWKEGKYTADGVDNFHRTCKSNGVPVSDYNVVAGWYEEVLSQLSNVDAPSDCCMAYIDCDLYSSTIPVLKFIEPRLKHGMIIGFDDYHTWSASQLSGERRACEEIFANHQHWILTPYMQIGWHGMAFIVEDRSLHSCKRSAI